MCIRDRRWCASTKGDYAWAFDNPADTLTSSIAGTTLFGADVTEFLDNEICLLYTSRCV